MWSHNDENIMLCDYITSLGFTYFMWSFWPSFLCVSGWNNDNRQHVIGNTNTLLLYAHINIQHIFIYNDHINYIRSHINVITYTQLEMKLVIMKSNHMLCDHTPMLWLSLFDHKIFLIHSTQICIKLTMLCDQIRITKSCYVITYQWWLSVCDHMIFLIRSTQICMKLCYVIT